MCMPTETCWAVPSKYSLTNSTARLLSTPSAADLIRDRRRHDSLRAGRRQADAKGVKCCKEPGSHSVSSLAQRAAAKQRRERCANADILTRHSTNLSPNIGYPLFDSTSDASS